MVLNTYMFFLFLKLYLVTISAPFVCRDVKYKTWFCMKRAKINYGNPVTPETITFFPQGGQMGATGF